VDWGRNTPSSPALASERRRSVASADQTAFTESFLSSDTVGSQFSDTFLPPPRSDPNFAEYSPYALQISPRNHSSISSASPGFSHGSHASPGSGDFPPDIENGLANLNEHEACLMRYFVVQLAPWVSIFHFSHFQSLTFKSLIYAMVRGISPVQCHFEL
jgi:hypothetical protein